MGPTRKKKKTILIQPLYLSPLCPEPQAARTRASELEMASGQDCSLVKHRKRLSPFCFISTLGFLQKIENLNSTSGSSITTSVTILIKKLLQPHNRNQMGNRLAPHAAKWMTWHYRLHMLNEWWCLPWKCHATSTSILPSGPLKQQRQRYVLAHPSPHHLGGRRSRRGTVPSQEFCNRTCMVQSAKRLIIDPKSMTSEIQPSKIGKGEEGLRENWYARQSCRHTTPWPVSWGKENPSPLHHGKCCLLSNVNHVCLAEFSTSKTKHQKDEACPACKRKRFVCGKSLPVRQNSLSRSGGVSIS